MYDIQNRFLIFQMRSYSL